MQAKQLKRSAYYTHAHTAAGLFAALRDRVPLAAGQDGHELLVARRRAALGGPHSLRARCDAYGEGLGVRALVRAGQETFLLT